MKIVYIAHPIGGDVQENLKRISLICKEINLNEPNIVPFAPYYLDCITLNDSIEEERNRCIRNDKELFSRRFIDELRVYGNDISRGVAAEIELAYNLYIPIRFMDHSLYVNRFDVLQRFIEKEKCLEILSCMVCFQQHIIDRIKTFEDALEATGKPDGPNFSASFVLGITGNMVENFQAQYKLVVIAEALNEGWEPDWNNGEQAKWVPTFHMVSSKRFEYYDTKSFNYNFACYGSRICFKSEELA